MTEGFLICEKCGGYYELQEGESADDFESCQCGGRLIYSPVYPPESSAGKNPYMNDNDDEVLERIENAVDHVVNSSDETVHDHPIYTIEYTGQIKKFNNGKISFNYPAEWTVTTIVPDEKYEGKNPDETIKYTIYRKSDIEYITFDELLDVWDDIFESQNINLTSKSTDKKGNIETFLITGNNSEKKNLVIIAGFKFFDFLYYFHFIISTSIKDKYQAATGLIIQSFQLNKLKHTMEGF